jgi:hypothetical protein
MKIVKIIILFTCVFPVHGFMNHRNAYLLEKSGLSKKNRNFFYEVLTTIDHATTYQQICAVRIASSHLQKIIDEKMNVYQSVHEEDKGPLGLAIDIVEIQKKHFDDFARISLHYLPYIKRCLGFLNVLFEDIKTRFFYQKATSIDILVDKLLRYTSLERTECLQTYWNVKHYFAFQKDIIIPEIVNFWEYRPLRFSLSKKIKHYTSVPKIQSALVQAGKVASTVKMGTTALKSASGIALNVASDGKTLAIATKGATVSMAPRVLGEVVALSDDVLLPLTRAGKIEAAMVSGLDDQIAIVKAADKLDDLAKGGLKGGNKGAKGLSEAAAADAKTAKSLGLVSEGKAVGDVAETASSLKIATPKIESIDIPKGVISQDPKVAADAYITSLKDSLGASTDKFSKIKTELVADQAVASKIASSKAVKNKALIDINESRLTLQSDIKSQISQLDKVSKSFAKSDPIQLDISKQVTTLKEISKQAKSELSLSLGAGRVARFKNYLKIAADMMVQMGIQFGTELAIAWIDEKDAKIFAELTLRQAELQSSFQSTINAIQATAQSQIQFSEQTASWSLGILQAQQANVISAYSNQQTYLLQSLVQASIAQNYVSNPMVWDQYFLSAPMYTPTRNMQLPGTVAAKNMPQKGVDASVIPYPAKQQVFYKGPWAVTPVLRTKSLADTTMWKFVNGKLTIESLNSSSGVGALPSLAATSSAVMPSITFPSVLNPIDHTWYNIGRRGAWGYNPSDDSFYQYQVVGNSSVAFPAGGDGAEAGFNSIFTEYIPPIVTDSMGIPTYIVQAEMQVNSGQSPWVAGIAFNRARWISGVTDTMNQYRFFGLYSSNKSSGITFCGAESFYVTSTLSNATNMAPITPLVQIMANSSQSSLWKSVGSSFIGNPLYPATTNSKSVPLALGQTYVITIATQPNQVIVTLDLKNQNNTTTTIFGPLAIANRNPVIFNGHSLGFVSSGCSSRFRLMQPKELVYAPNDIKTFSQLISLGSKT